MMSMRKLGVIGALLLSTIAVANALTLSANPSSVIVKAGSSNYTTVTFYESTVSGIYAFNASSITNPLIGVTVYGPYLDPNFTQPVIVGGTNYTTTATLGTQITWPGNASTNYYFKVVFTAPNTITTTQTFTCTISGAVASLVPLSIKVSGTAVSGIVPPIPELATGILLTIGLAGLMIVKRKE